MDQTKQLWRAGGPDMSGALTELRDFRARYDCFKAEADSYAALQGELEFVLGQELSAPLDLGALVARVESADFRDGVEARLKHSVAQVLYGAFRGMAEHYQNT